jgi:hypothetical protein
MCGLWSYWEIDSSVVVVVVVVVTAAAAVDVNTKSTTCKDANHSYGLPLVRISTMMAPNIVNPLAPEFSFKF